MKNYLLKYTIRDGDNELDQMFWVNEPEIDINDREPVQELFKKCLKEFWGQEIENYDGMGENVYNFENDYRAIWLDDIREITDTEAEILSRTGAVYHLTFE